MPDSLSGFQFEKRFSTRPDSAISIRYIIRNVSEKEKQVAAWDVCRTKGGICFFPVGSPANIPENKLNRTKTENGILWYDFDAESILSPQKLFSMAKEGWLAHVSDDLLFIKKFPDIQISQLSPEQGEIEIFAQKGGLYIELENHGPYTTLKPGEELSYDQTWYLLPLKQKEQTQWVNIVRKSIKYVQ
jgi:hypothetical protein